MEKERCVFVVVVVVGAGGGVGAAGGCSVPRALGLRPFQGPCPKPPKGLCRSSLQLFWSLL